MVFFNTFLKKNDILGKNFLSQKFLVAKYSSVGTRRKQVKDE